MSTLKTNNVQVGQSATAAQNFVLAVPAVPNGTSKLSRGNAGATTADILTIGADNSVNIVSNLLVAGAAIPTLSTNTFTGNQSGGDNKLIRWLAQDIGSVFLDRGTVSTGTVTFDYSAGSAQRLQVGGALTVALSNFPPAGNLGVIQLEFVNAGSAAVTFPTINWIQVNGTFTTSISTYLTNVGRNALQTSGVDFVLLWSRDAGVTVYGKIL